MKEIIERQAAIAHAISGLTREFDGEKWIRVSEVRESLQTMPSAEQWIPSSERLPEEGESVVLCGIDGYMGLGRLVRPDEGCYKWDMGAWWNDIEDWDAWMPLPEPYKMEVKNDE